MKKLKVMFISLAVAVMIFVLSFTAFGAETEYTSGVFTYTVTDGEATITGCDSSVEGHLVIPEMLDGYKVSRIESRAFYSCVGITDVTFPSSLKTTGYNTFANSLENIYIDSLESWLNIHFESGAMNPMVPAENLYIHGELVTELVIPENITEIPDNAFSGCDSIVSIKLPATLKK